LVGGQHMTDFSYYIFNAIVLVLALCGAFYAPCKALMLLISGKSPLFCIPKYQFLTSVVLSLFEAVCAFFFYVANKGEYEVFSYLSIYFLIQACLMLVCTYMAKASGQQEG